LAKALERATLTSRLWSNLDHVEVGVAQQWPEDTETAAVGRILRRPGDLHEPRPATSRPWPAARRLAAVDLLNAIVGRAQSIDLDLGQGIRRRPAVFALHFSRIPMAGTWIPMTPSARPSDASQALSTASLTSFNWSSLKPALGAEKVCCGSRRV